MSVGVSDEEARKAATWWRANALIKAGAVIAAEIARIERSGGTCESK